MEQDQRDGDGATAPGDIRVEDRQPTTTNPALWLVSSDVSRRLTVRGRQIRTQVGMATMIDQFVETIPLDDVKRVEVLAPYSPPSSRLGMILLGCAIGALVGTESETLSSLVMAITILAFALVTLVVSRSVTAAHRIARLSMDDGRAYCIAYRHEDEAEMRALFKNSEWSDDTVSMLLTALTPEEKHHADGMRYGLVLSASAFALIVLYATSRSTEHLPALIGIPTEIVVTAVWCITIGINIAAWGRVLIHRTGVLQKFANRRRP